MEIFSLLYEKRIMNFSETSIFCRDKGMNYNPHFSLKTFKKYSKIVVKYGLTNIIYLKRFAKFSKKTRDYVIDNDFWKISDIEMAKEYASVDFEELLDNEFIRAYISTNPSFVQLFPEFHHGTSRYFPDNLHYAMEAAKHGEISSKFSDNKQIVILALSNSNNVKIPPFYEKDREVIISGLISSGMRLQYLKKSLREDKEINFISILSHSNSIKFGSFYNDRDMALLAVKQNGSALRFISESLRNDREIVLTAVKSYDFALEWASDRLRDDREIVLTAVKSEGLALEFASELLQDDREIVLTAVKQNGYALKIKDFHPFNSDEEIVIAAIARSGPGVLKYVSIELLENRKFHKRWMKLPPPTKKKSVFY